MSKSHFINDNMSFDTMSSLIYQRVVNTCGGEDGFVVRFVPGPEKHKKGTDPKKLRFQTEYTGFSSSMWNLYEKTLSPITFGV